MAVIRSHPYLTQSHSCTIVTIVTIAAAGAGAGAGDLVHRILARW
jgi:hypothetical protein